VCGWWRFGSTFGSQEAEGDGYSNGGGPAMNAVLGFFQTKMGLVVSLLLAALGAYLLLTHTGHILAALPYLLLLACPLMHFVGHGHGHKHDGQADQRNSGS
jgi:hypothetical protein